MAEFTICPCCLKVINLEIDVHREKKTLFVTNVVM